ncbi:MAG: PilZ domain-containing protein [Desulfobacteraceae bacterium]|nr:PilZ domain-containing protein [Desulfobacteraceae bacterium]
MNLENHEKVERKKVCFRNEHGGYFVYDERDRRRMGFHESLTYRRNPNGEVYKAKIFDISNHGMSFISDYPFLKGTTLYFLNENDNEENYEKGNVVWAKFYQPFSSRYPRYRIGVEFE